MHRCSFHPPRSLPRGTTFLGSPKNGGSRSAFLLLKKKIHTPLTASPPLFFGDRHSPTELSHCCSFDPPRSLLRGATFLGSPKNGGSSSTFLPLPKYTPRPTNLLLLCSSRRPSSSTRPAQRSSSTNFLSPHLSLNVAAPPPQLACCLFLPPPPEAHTPQRQLTPPSSARQAPSRPVRPPRIIFPRLPLQFPPAMPRSATFCGSLQLRGSRSAFLLRRTLN